MGGYLRLCFGPGGTPGAGAGRGAWGAPQTLDDPAPWTIRPGRFGDPAGDFAEIVERAGVSGP